MAETPQKPKLFQFKACPYCWKVRVALALKGVEFETIEVNPLTRKEISFSPRWQRVPIFIDRHGRQIDDSAPIMRHLDREYRDPPLFTNVFEEKAAEDAWMAWSDRFARSVFPNVYGSFGKALQARAYIQEFPQFSSLDRLKIRYLGAFQMSHQARSMLKEMENINPTTWAKHSIDEWVEKALKGRAFAGGETPNGPDVAVFGISYTVHALPAANLFRENSAFYAWMRRMSEASGYPLFVLSS